MAVKTTDEFVIPISIKDDVTNKLKMIEAAVKGLNNTLNMGSGGEGLKKVSENVKKVSKETTDASSSISIFGTTLSKMGATVFTANAYLDFFNRTIRTFSTVIGGAVAPAMELEKGLAQISTVVPDGSKSIESFGKDILNFQRNFGSNQSDIIRGYYDILQSGAVDAAEATKLMDTAQRMAVAGYSTSDKMIQGLVSVMANYNMTAEESVRIADLMAIANKNGRVTIEGLAENIGNVAGMARFMNISLEETLSAMSTISMSTSNAGEAMTSFRSILTGMSTQTGEFQQVIERLGYSSIQAMIAQKGFLGTIKALTTESGLSAEGLSNIFGRVEAKLGLIALTADKTGAVYTKNMSEMEDAAYKVGDVIETQFGKSLNTADQKLNILKASFSAFMSSAGLGFMSDLKSVYESLTNAIDVLAISLRVATNIYKELFDDTVKMTEATKELAKIFASLGVASLVVSFNSLIDVVVKATTAFRALMVAMSPLLVAGAKIALVTAAIYGVIWAIDKLIDVYNDAGTASDEATNTMAVNANKLYNDQKNLHSEMINTNATMSEMSDKFRTIGADEYFAKANRSVKSYNDQLAESISKFGKQTSEFKKTYPEIKKLFISAELSANELAKYNLFDDSKIGEYQSALNKLAVAYRNIAETQADVNKEVNKNPSRKDELTNRLLEAKRKYQEALLEFKKMAQKEISGSVDERFDIQVNIDLQASPFTGKLLEIQKKIEKFKEINQALEIALPSINDDRLKSSIKREMQERLKALYILIDEEEKLRKAAAFEVDNKAMDEKAGKPLLSTEELINIQKSLDSPFSKFTKDLSDVLRNDLKFDKFREGVNYLSDAIYKGFGLGIEDFQNVMADFWLQKPAPKMGDVPGAIESSVLSEGMSSMSSAMGGMMGAIGAAGTIADAIGAAANAIANIPQKIADALNAIVDMPKTFMKGLNSIVEVIPKIFSEFIPALLDAFNELFKLPMKIVDGLLSGLEKLFASDFLQKIGKALINFFVGIWPRIIIAFVRLVIGVVKLIFNIIKSLPRLVMDFIKGIIDAIKDIINEVFKAIGVGEIFKTKVAIDEKSIGNISEAIKNGSQQMFAVLDADSEKKGTGIMAKIQAALAKAGDELKKVTKGLWEVWKWVRDKILMPLWYLVKDAWLWVWNKVIEPLIDGLKKAWLWVWEKVFSPIIDAIKKDWLKFLDNLKAVWLKVWGLMDKIISPLKDIFGKGFDYLFTGIGKLMFGIMNIMSIIRPLMDGFGQLLRGFFDILSSIPTLISDIIGGLKSFIQQIPDTIKGWFSKVGNYLTIALEKVAGFIVKIFANLNVFEILNQIFLLFKNLPELFGKVLSIFEGAWSIFLDSLKALGSMIEGVWNFGVSIFNGVIDAFKTVLSLFSPIIDGIRSALSALGDFLKPVLSVFSNLGSSLSSAFSSIDFSKFGEEIGNGFKKIFDNLVSIFKTIYNVFAKMVNAIKIPSVGWKISAGSFGSWSGTLFSEVDLIPGEMSYLAAGGMARGTDVVPAMLTPGEFIVNRDATSKNIDLLRNINAGREPISSGSNPTFNITINAKTYLDQDAIKREILPTIEKELKRKSLDGSFVIAASGIRK